MNAKTRTGSTQIVDKLVVLLQASNQREIFASQSMRFADLHGARDWQLLHPPASNRALILTPV
jgi:hypothetical protein